MQLVAFIACNSLLLLNKARSQLLYLTLFYGTTLLL
jgi:hypothetical protein